MVSKSRILANLGKAVDSASTGHFLAKGVDSNGIFETILYTDLVGTPTTLDSALTSQLIDSSYVQLRQTASGGGIDSAAVTTLIDSSYVAARSSAGSSGFVRYEYDTTANGTTFQDSDKTGQVLSYTEDYILVHYNGILMADTDYTATSGSSVVFSSGVDSGGIVSITKFSAASSGGGGASFTWGGDRGMMIGGYVGSTEQSNGVYWSISTSASSTTFGNLSHKNVSSGSVSGGSGAYTLCGGYRYISGGNWSYNNNIDRISVPGTPSVSDFGDMTATMMFNGAWLGNETRALHAGGQSQAGSTVNTVEYFTFATPGNGTDFGDLLAANTHKNGGVSGSTYAVILGKGNTGSIQYLTPATPGNAVDFGDLTTTSHYVTGAVSDATVALCVFDERGSSSASQIDTITIATPGNATDHGDLTFQRGSGTDGCTDAIHAHFVGGRTISPYNDTPQVDKVTITTPGNATDFGDLSRATQSATAASGAAA